jgi:transketolase
MGSHGGAFSLAEILAVLYFHELNIDPQKPKWDPRDRVILSKAHTSPALYAAMALRGFFPIEQVYSYCEMDGILEGHTDMKRTPGLESSGGPLGMGLSVSAGIALGLRWKENPRARVYCILGDGETNEGNVWEAAMFAAHYHLDNLIGYARLIRHGIIGMGLNDYDTIFRILKEAGFDGWISIEDGVNGMEELQQSTDFLRRKISQCFG